MYPNEVDICNCGIQLNPDQCFPRPDLSARPGVEENSLGYRMQLSGAALYWIVATTSSKMLGGCPDMLNGKNVLEVACGRGGGAKYLWSVASPRRYVAVDADEAELGRSFAATHCGVEFMTANASDMTEHFPESSFDVVLCVQSIALFRDVPGFFKGALHCVKPGGQLLFCDLVTPEKFRSLSDALLESGFAVDAVHDLADAVNWAGICCVADGRGYFLVVASKPYVAE